MTTSTLVVAVTTPKESSKARIAAMARAAQHIDLDIVEITSDKSPTTGTASTSMQYRRRIPLSTFSDRLINLVATDGGRGSSIRRPLARWLRRRLRPTAQRLDRAIWPFTTAAERRRLVAKLEALITTYDRAYLIYTDVGALPQAIELAQSVTFSGSGSLELFQLISENAGDRREESS